MLLFYSASLLPDPDLPYSPAIPNLCVWAFSAASELAIAVELMLTHMSGDEGRQEKAELLSYAALGLGRFLIIDIMISVFLISRLASKTTTSDEEGAPAENSLLNDGDISKGYGAVTVQNHPPNDTQALSPFHYLNGFRKLIPYLWWVSTPSLTLV